MLLKIVFFFFFFALCQTFSANSEVNQPLGRGIIEIQQALVPMETGLFAGSRDTYVKLYVDNKYVGQTTVIEDNHNPKWYERIRTGPLRNDSLIRFVLWDKDYFDPDDYMGTAHLSMKEVVRRNLLNVPIHKEYSGGFIQFRMSILPCKDRACNT